MSKFHVGDRVRPIVEVVDWVGVVTKVIGDDFIELREERDAYHNTSVYTAHKFQIVQKNIYMEDTRSYMEAISNDQI